MANIRKTFNFRNGVQVDDDNLIVNQTGLVGIGTSVPTELLDVRGTAKIVGLVTATEVFANNITASGVSTFNGGLRVGIVSVGQNGIITATSVSGIVTYFGDGGKLLNLPTSQWLDVNIGLGFTSIYAQGFVGVNTTSPLYPFQVGGTDSTRLFESVGARGVGIDSTGNIYSTGIVTARSYNGIGIALTDLNASNITSGTLDNARLASNINISGILTATNIESTGLNVGSIGINVTGIVTANSGFKGNLTGNVTGNVTGTATTATSLSGTPNIVVGIVTATQLISNISSTGISTVTNRLYVGNSIGLNTVSPSADVHIYKSGNGGILVTSTQESYIGVAKSLTRGQQGGEIRFANLSDAFSGETSLDLVNYDNGNINQYIHDGAAGINTGNFNWVYGRTQTGRMTLTWDGKLGIAKTNPEHQLHVVGTSTITEDLCVGNDLAVKGDSTFIGDLTVSGNFTTNNLNVINGITANVNNTSGVSTFYNINVTNITRSNKVAIGTDTTNAPLQIGSSNSSEVLVFSGSSFIGIGTTLPTNEVQINAQNAAAIIRAVGVGTTRPRSAVDFADAGRGYFSDSKRFLIPPRVSTAERNALDVATINAAGAIVYNIQTNVHQAYNGTAWSDIGSGGGGTISYADSSGISTYSRISGFATDAANVIGGIVSCYQLNVYASGISTFSGITTVTGPTFFTKQLDVSGVATVSQLKVGTGVTISAGIVTATEGFLSGIGTAVKITTIGNQLVFNVPGVGSTSLTLY